MPGMTGTRAMQILRTDAKFAGVPMVALTAHAREDEHAAALAAGFDQVISKPCLPGELLRSIRPCWRMSKPPVGSSIKERAL
jgi:two-component system sensor histidine kinase/response regulator